MLHPVPFDVSLKNDPPPHPGDDQSSKRAKIDEGRISEDRMEAEQSPPVGGSNDNHAFVAYPEELDVQMGGDVATPIPSFKDKLLNVDLNPMEEEDKDIVLNQGDVSLSMNGKIPTVDFASHVIETLNKKMGLAVVVKLLGRKIGFRHLLRFQDDLDYQNALLTGLWMIFRHYLTVQPWTPSFKSQDHVVNQVIGWIRLSKLPARYYHKSIIRSIGGVFGEVIKVDYNTESGDRGKFARIAVVIDLTKPLISKIQVDGDLIFVEYEGLPSICFDCGLYGHLQDSCPSKMVAETRVPTGPSSSSDPIVPDQVARETPHFGEWMQVQRRRRPVVRGNKANVVTSNKSVVNNSRFEVLGDTLDEERQIPQEQGGGIYYLNNETPVCRAKAKETKGAKKAVSGPKLQSTPPLHRNLDNGPHSKQYVIRRSDSSLDQSSNSAVRIEDHRAPLTNQVSKGSKVGPGRLKPIEENDSHSKGRGVTLSHGVHIHKLGPKPNSGGAGPSFRVLKELARAGIFVLLEPRISEAKADYVIKKLGFHNSQRVEATGFSGGIWILCPQKQFRNILWQDLDLLADGISSPWMLAGDFNAILHCHER
ncbi:hypothetical protein K1719_027177 [Acacia pycnantha]|nr:hypothetical protein K1719_027177 [Acacia pycnantha]